jgi:hypothetical protein
MAGDGVGWCRARSTQLPVPAGVSRRRRRAGAPASPAMMGRRHPVRARALTGSDKLGVEDSDKLGSGNYLWDAMPLRAQPRRGRAVAAGRDRACKLIAALLRA